MEIAAIIAGLVFLTVGGDALVRGSVATARRLGVSPMIIGLTLVGFGTSTPELVTSLQAAFAGSPGVAVGNVVGSNIANFLLILGVSALVFPVVCDRRALGWDGLIAAGAAIALTLAALTVGFDRWVGLAFVALLAGYLFATWLRERGGVAPEEADLHVREGGVVGEGAAPLWRSLLIAFAGIVITILGARFLVFGAIEVARGFSVPETVIGLTIVAVGTSLPELVTSLIAAFRKESDIALGNVLGSNIFNVLAILGVTAMIRPMEAPADIAGTDVWVMLAATALVLFFAFTNRKISRLEGGVMVLLYATYIGLLAIRAGAGAA
ncbi:calcium/sodium antiporter [Euryhalocaulis caribicus]|uniref:calcium/sodium antiporter n=1 Tax=Euryhalocaulis caribicus TaxID=1161401 RepID=UPI0003A58165|nr:calcium/sodium antiporter [Euryhalocaulis caribicus]